MEPPGGRDSRFNLGYSMNLLSGETAPEIYGNPSLGRPSTSLQQLSPRHTMVSSACGGRGLKSDMYDERGMSSQNMGLEACGVNDISEDTYSSLQSKKSPPSNGKKTKGRVKIKMEYIENKLRRYTTFSKRKTGIMKKAYELSTLTGTQVMLLVASETGHVYTFATRKLQPMITSEAGKALIQTCLNSPDPPAGSAGGDQRMSATGFEETELTYNISDEDSKEGEDGFCDTSTSSEDEELPDSNRPENRPSRSPLFSQVKEMSDKNSSMHSKKSRIEVSEANNTPSKSPINENSDTDAASFSTANGTSNNQKQLPQSKIFQNIPQITTVNSSVVTMPSLAASLSSMAQPTTKPVSSISEASSSVIPPSQLQASPLWIQTPAGIGYATTPDGMILGILQGTNLGQPQLVAIPNDNMSGADSSDSCSDGEMDTENPLSVFVPPDTPSFSTLSPPSSPFQQKPQQRQSSPATPTPCSTPSSSSTSTKTQSITTSQPSILSPLVYQTPQGMMYATPSNGGVILSLAQGDPNSSHPQFITIPLSMVATNGQGELDLSKRK